MIRLLLQKIKGDEYSIAYQRTRAIEHYKGKICIQASAFPEFKYPFLYCMGHNQSKDFKTLTIPAKWINEVNEAINTLNGDWGWIPLELHQAEKACYQVKMQPLGDIHFLSSNGVTLSSFGKFPLWNEETSTLFLRGKDKDCDYFVMHIKSPFVFDAIREFNELARNPVELMRKKVVII